MQRRGGRLACYAEPNRDRLLVGPITTTVAGTVSAVVVTAGASSAGKGREDTAFREAYGCSRDRVLEGPAATSFWDLQAGDSLLEFVLKAKRSPFAGATEEQEVVEKLLNRMLACSGATPQQSVERLRSAMHKAQQDMRVGFGDHRIQGAHRVLQLAQDILTRGMSWAPAGNEEAAAAAGEAEAAEVVN